MKVTPDDTRLDTAEAVTPTKGDGGPPALEQLPCSATQERCWFLDQMNPGTPALNVAIRWYVNGRFSAKAFEAAFREVIARHEILRTRFALVDGRPVQEVMETAPFHLSEIDIRTTPPEAQEDRIEAIAIENASLPFDLTKPGPIRATLIRLANDRAILAITVHQICFDGWSIKVLGREIGEFAAAYESEGTPDVPELPLQYGDYALWQQDYFKSPAFAAELAPLKERLQGASYFELQPDFPRPLNRTASCAMVKTDLPPAFGDRLNAAAKERAMSPFAYGAGVLSAMLARCADAPEVLIGTQVAGRTEVELEPLIGVFINNVVMQFATPSESTLNDHLGRAAKVVREALMGQNVPFNKLVEIVNPPRDSSRTPLISVNFILQNAFMETARYGDFELSSAPSHAPGAIYDLSFMMVGRETGWRMTLEYNTDLFGRDTADDLLALWQEAFAFAFDHPDRPLSEMPEPKLCSKSRTDEARQLTRIEDALGAHALVGEAAAVPYSGEEATRRVHAFVTPRSDAPVVPLERLPAVLAEHLASHLAPGDGPDGISVLRDMPRDGAGRIARARLPLAEAARHGARTAAPALAAPANAGEASAVEAVEKRLAAIWSELLAIDTIPPSASFFELGGHSLLTVRMLAGIEREFGQRLSLATAFEVPTLRALARHLAGVAEAPEQEPEPERAPEPVAATPAPEVQPAAAAMPGQGDWRVLPLQEKGEGIPLIAINNAQTVFALSQAFETPRPATAVRIFDKSRGIELVDRPFEEIAADYVDAVRSAQPKGPYALFGVCVHGNLAIEVARLLQEQGEEVAAVIVKDVWEPSYADRVRASFTKAMLNRFHFLKVRLRFLRRGDISLPAFLGMFRIVRATGIIQAGVKLGLIERVRNTDLDAEQEEFIAYLSRARNVHMPAPYAGRVLHFVTRESPTKGPFDPEMGWGRLVKGKLETVQMRELSIAQGRRDGIADAARKIEEVLKEEDGRERSTAAAPVGAAVANAVGSGESGKDHANA